MDFINNLLELSNLDGISSREEAVGDYLIKVIDAQSEKDTFKNVYFGNIHSNKKRVAIYCHQDEVGFIINKIDASGYLYFSPFGNWNIMHLISQKVTITARKNNRKINGIIQLKPVKLHEATFNDLYIDLGIENKAEIDALGIQLGDMVTPYSPPRLSPDHHFIIGKALDNRVGCAIMAEVMNHFSTEKFKNIEVIGVGTAQEEVGTRGSKVASSMLESDINLIIDVADGKDTPGIQNNKKRILGNGPGLCLYDKTAIGSIELIDEFVKMAEKNEFIYQYDYFTGGGTDAGSIQQQYGKPTIVISVPVRYCHTWNSIVKISDCLEAVKMITTFINHMNHVNG